MNKTGSHYESCQKMLRIVVLVAFKASDSAHAMFY